MATKFITPTGAGNLSGSDWANAGGPANLGTIFSAAALGDQIWLSAGAGAYSQTIAKTLTNTNLNTSGTATNHIEIRGMLPFGTNDGLPFDVLVVGNRADPWAFGGAIGVNLFNIQSPHIWFRNIIARNWGFVFHLQGNIAGTRVMDCKAYNVDFFMEQDIAFNPTAVLVQRCSAHGFGGKFARFKGTASNLRFEDCYGKSQWQQSGASDFPGGLVFGTSGGAVSNVRVKRCQMDSGYQYSDATNYRNGDGFTNEEECSDMIFEDCSASGWTDSGWDVKATGTILRRCTAEDNKKNYRFHYGLPSGFIMEDCVSRNPRKRGGTTRSNHLLVDGGVPNFPGCTLDVRRCHFESTEGGLSTDAVFIEFTTITGIVVRIKESTIILPSSLTEMFQPPGTSTNTYAKTNSPIITFGA
jgi:hypothetical protein